MDIFAIDSIKTQLENNIDLYKSNVIKKNDEQAERICKTAKKKIINAESKLKEAGISIEEFNFEVNTDEPKETLVEQITIKKNIEVESTIFKLKSKREEKGTIGLKVKDTNLEKIEVFTKEYEITSNALVAGLFEELYDESTESLNFDVEEKINSEAKATSYTMKKKVINALDKLAKEKGYNRTELFNIILEKQLQNEK